METLSILCFSKDRPLQLHGYIESLSMFQIPYELTVLYDYSNQHFKDGYEKLISYFPKVIWIEEQNPKSEINNWAESANDFIMFGCDDVIFTGPIDYKSITHLKADPQLLVFSCRLGNNVTYSYSHQGPINYLPPAPSKDPDLLEWEWQTAGIEFNYPFELNATVNRKEDVLKYFSMIPDIKWHPNHLEGHWHNEARKRQFAHRSKMMSYKDAKCVCVTVNRVQNESKNHIYNDKAIDASVLNELYLNGHRMDVNYYITKIYDRIHCDDLKIKKME